MDKGNEEKLSGKASPLKYLREQITLINWLASDLFCPYWGYLLTKISTSDKITVAL